MNKVEEKVVQTVQETELKKVAVYGSLLSGLGNHGLLTHHDAKLLGKETLNGNYKMISLGGFPGVYEVSEEEGSSIEIEVYEVSPPCEKSLDLLEGYRKDDEFNSFYLKRPVETSYGTTDIYFINKKWHSNNSSAIEQGDWRKFLSNKNRDIL